MTIAKQQQLGPLVAGVLLGYILTRTGQKLMVVCPPGETPPQEIQPITYLPPTGPLPLGVREAYVLSPIDETLAAGIAPRDASTTYYLDSLLDAKLAQKVLLVVTSSCNQAVTIQVIGHTSNSPSDAGGVVNISGTQSLAASGKLGFGIDLTTDWYPWLGVTVAAGGTPPTAGAVVVRAYGQRWKNIAAEGSTV